MRLWYLIGLLFSCYANSYFESVESNEFKYIDNDDKAFHVKVDGYIKNENIRAKVIGAVASSINSQEINLSVPSEIKVKSPISTVYTVDLLSPNEEYGVRSGTAFIILMDNGQYLFAFYYRECLTKLTQPRVELDPLMHQLSNNLHNRTIYFPDTFAPEFYSKLYHSGCNEAF